MDSMDFAEVFASSTRIEPIGEQRADYRAAMIAAQIIRAAGGSADPRDYLLRFSDPKPPGTPQQREERIKQAMAESRAVTKARNVIKERSRGHG